MRVTPLLPQAVMLAVLLGFQATTALAGFSLRLNAADLEKLGPGPLTANVGVLLNWDGVGTNLLSGINFDVTVPANVTLPDVVLTPGTPENPFSFSNASVSAQSAAFANIAGNVAPLVAGDNLLTTLHFNVNAVQGDFLIGLSVVSAQTGSNFTDITNLVTASGGTLRVVVPEPSSLTLLGLVTVSGFGWRCRRSRPIC